MRESINRHQAGWLAAGAALIALSQMRWGIGLLAFVAPVPFLHYLRHARGVRPRLWFALAAFAGYTLATLKIVTTPLPMLFAIGFSIPFTLAHGGGYLLTAAIRRRHGGWIGTLAFPAAMVVAEYAMHRLTPFGSWAAAAYTQVDNLPLLQVASVAGLAGVSFVVYFVASGIEAALAEPRAKPQLAAAFTVLAVAVSYGTLRLAAATPGETVTVAAIGTDSTIAGWPLPSRDELDRVDDALFARTAQAAASGATLVAWNEAATAVAPEREAAFVARLQTAARTHRIELVASFIVPDDATRTYENKYVWLRPDGSVDHIYNKHHPVPGEPMTPGAEPTATVETAAGRATGAICYDYDFPALALEQARHGIDLAVVPSSDWRGIDPIHTQMASLRAIEGGFSLLRSTRWGLSAGYDPYGRARGWESSFDSDKRILLVGLPKQGMPTIYTTVGDSFVLLCGVFVTIAAVLVVRRREPAGLPGRTISAQP